RVAAIGAELLSPHKRRSLRGDHRTRGSEANNHSQKAHRTDRRSTTAASLSSYGRPRARIAACRYRAQTPTFLGRRAKLTAPLVTSCRRSQSAPPRAKRWQAFFSGHFTAGIAHVGAQSRHNGSNPAVSAKSPVQRAADSDDHGDNEKIPIAPFELRHELEVHAVDAGDRGRHREDGGP